MAAASAASADAGFDNTGDAAPAAAVAVAAA